MTLVADNPELAFELLTRTTTRQRTRCVDGLRVNPARVAALVRGSLLEATALSPYLGYEVRGRARQSGADHWSSLPRRRGQSRPRRSRHSRPLARTPRHHAAAARGRCPAAAASGHACLRGALIIRPCPAPAAVHTSGDDAVRAGRRRRDSLADGRARGAGRRTTTLRRAPPSAGPAHRARRGARRGR